MLGEGDSLVLVDEEVLVPVEGGQLEDGTGAWRGPTSTCGWARRGWSGSPSRTPRPAGQGAVASARVGRQGLPPQRAARTAGPLMLSKGGADAEARQEHGGPLGLLPHLVVLDPISAFDRSGDLAEIQALLLRMVDFLKSHGITGVFTHLTHAKSDETETDAGLSSLMDAWILMLNREVNGEFNRELYLLKARGMQHSNQVREFIMSSQGIQLREPYIGAGGALTGSARRAQEGEARRQELLRTAEVSRIQQQIEHRRKKLEAQIDILRADVAADEIELKRLLDEEAAQLKQAEADAATARSGRVGLAERRR